MAAVSSVKSVQGSLRTYPDISADLSLCPFFCMTFGGWLSPYAPSLKFSGGTTAGIGLGCHLAHTGEKVHAYGVCDDPKYFYDYCQEILDGMGASADIIGASSADLFRAIQAKGHGYAISTEEELSFVKEVAETTGIILDPVYSGKALYQFAMDVQKDPKAWEGRRVLFSCNACRQRSSHDAVVAMQLQCPTSWYAACLHRCG